MICAAHTRARSGSARCASECAPSLAGLRYSAAMVVSEIAKFVTQNPAAPPRPSLTVAVRIRRE